jgi:hypothetical protein
MDSSGAGQALAVVAPAMLAAVVLSVLARTHRSTKPIDSSVNRVIFRPPNASNIAVPRSPTLRAGHPIGGHS